VPVKGALGDLLDDKRGVVEDAAPDQLPEQRFEPAREGSRDLLRFVFSSHVSL
jgi:hypothetical protein